MKWLATALLCAACASAAPEVDCGDWRLHPSRGVDRPTESLVAVGVSSPDAADPWASAQRAALLSLAAQLHVQVDSHTAWSEEILRDGGDLTTTERSDTSAHLLAHAVLRGAEVRRSCSRDGATVVLVALDKHRARESAEAWTAQARRDLRGLLDEARRAAAAGDTIGEAAALGRALTVAEQVQRASPLLELDGGAPRALQPSVEELRSRLVHAQGRAAVSVAVDAPIEMGHVAGLLASAVSARALSIRDDSAAQLRAVVTVEAMGEAAAGLYLARADIHVDLSRGTTSGRIASSSSRSKGSGTTPEAAARDAVRRAADQHLTTLVDEALAMAGMPRF